MQADLPYTDRDFITYKPWVIKMSYTVPGLSVAVTTLSVSVYGLSVFLACPAEILSTLWLNTWTLPVLMGSVKVRLVMFETGLFAFKYG